MDTLELINEYIKRHVNNPPESLTPESRLDGIGVDSLALLELLFELEEKYDINLPNDMSRPETVGQLIEIVEKLKPATVNE